MDFVALNNSGVQGGAFLALDFETNQLTVLTGAIGVEAGEAHPQHIHGFPSATPDAETPTIAQDDDLDGFVELAEGLDTYGPVLLNLTSPPESGHSGFPTPAGDSFVFVQTYDFDNVTFDENPNDNVAGVPLRQILTADNLDEREIVLHDLTLAEGQGENGGEADGTAGYKAVLPIASGEIQRLTGEEVAYSFSEARFQLGNQVAALDIQGGAGQAYRLYDIFDRDPDREGLNAWVEALDEGARHTDVARSFLTSDEFTLDFRAVGSLSNETYVNVLYDNVLDRAADTQGLVYWTNQLNQGLTRDALFVAFAESPENQTQVAPLLANGILLRESVLV